MMVMVSTYVLSYLWGKLFFYLLSWHWSCKDVEVCHVVLAGSIIASMGKAILADPGNGNTSLLRSVTHHFFFRDFSGEILKKVASLEISSMNHPVHLVRVLIDLRWYLERKAFISSPETEQS